ncbi:Inactive [Strongyloides ratti]|uniref:Inactive n=1 Tax=Strongyloides ratti TaxID=34506 RepID=A0A090LPB7_STRRB|nr:Inactive [Strongyloides ratti]CEF71670.1 Inactive [Strongyloides ratti]
MLDKLKNKFIKVSGKKSIRGQFDPDEKWSNLYREREKNHLYKWVGVRSGEEGVLKFASEKIEPMLYDDGKKPQLIKYTDYCKWKKTANVQLGRVNSEGEDSIGYKFREHYSQWKLNKRGVDGETVLHLLLNREDLMCGEIARILITKYPGLSNDIYLGDEMFGQSALHLAIVHDDYDTVQLLLENDADVKARACGNFFMPEDSNFGKSIDYQGYAYYGEYPLAFAACFGNKDIYDLLIQYGADPNLQDMYGNTILHMCVINYSSSMYSYAVRHWEKPAQPHIVNNAGYTPLTLASKLGRRQIFEEMLELMKVEFWRFSDMTCSAYPLTALDTIKPDGSTNYDSALMTVINGDTAEHLEMIGSEVIQRLLADKWKAFASRKLFERLSLLVFHLVCLCFVVYLRPTELERLYMIEPKWDDYIRSVFEILVILSCLSFVFIQQLGEFRTQGFYGYFQNLKTAPAKVVFFMANICLLACVPFRILKYYQVEEGLLVFALPGSWIFLLFFARSAKLTGPFVQMIYSMIAGDMIRFAIISAIFLVSFSQVFFFVGKDMSAKQNLTDGDPNKCNISGYTIYTYSSFLETFITLFRASMGGYDYEEFDCANYEGLTKGLFVLYMFVMPIMMINILIAMMGNTYTTIITQAEKAWRQQYAQIVMVLERSMNKDKLAACQLEYSIKLNETGDTETRGLMVIKQTRKTRAKQRKHAISNWKNIGRKVIETIHSIGTDYAKAILHSHERIYIDSDIILTSNFAAHKHRTSTITQRTDEKIPISETIPYIDDNFIQKENNLTPPLNRSVALIAKEDLRQQSIDTEDEDMHNLISHIERRSALNHPNSISSLSLTDQEQMTRELDLNETILPDDIKSNNDINNKITLTNLATTIDFHTKPVVSVAMLTNSTYLNNNILNKNELNQKLSIRTIPNMPHISPKRNHPSIFSLSPKPSSNLPIIPSVPSSISNVPLTINHKKHNNDYNITSKHVSKKTDIFRKKESPATTLSSTLSSNDNYSTSKTREVSLDIEELDELSKIK